MPSPPIKTYCIIGDPVEHSLSPIMQNSAFAYLGLNSSYFSFRVPHGELKPSIESLKSIGIGGFNVTIPHKISILKYKRHLYLGLVCMVHIWRFVILFLSCTDSN